MDEDTTILSDLERAELEARERRLAAETAAEVLVAAARREAAQIETGVAARAAGALAELRRGIRAEADAEIARLRAEIVGLEAAEAAEAGGAPGQSAAIERLVAAVLGEGSVDGRTRPPPAGATRLPSMAGRALASTSPGGTG